MKMCDGNCCDIDFDEDDEYKDNGYRYILNELKRIRADVDKTIDLLEKRIEKDSIIDDVLSTDYDDEDHTDSSDILKEIGEWQKKHKDFYIYPYYYPWWQIHPNTTTYWTSTGLPNLRFKK